MKARRRGSPTVFSMILRHGLLLLLLAAGVAAAGRQLPARSALGDAHAGARSPHGRQLTQATGACQQRGAATFSLAASFTVLGEPGSANLSAVLATCLGLGPCQFRARGSRACSARARPRDLPGDAAPRSCAAGARGVLACGGLAASPALAQAAAGGRCAEDAQGRGAVCLGAVVGARLHASLKAGKCTAQCTAVTTLPLVAAAGAGACTAVQLELPAARRAWSRPCFHHWLRCSGPVRDTVLPTNGVRQRLR